MSIGRYFVLLAFSELIIAAFVGVKGLYEAMFGGRITWAAWKEGILVTALMSIYRPTDFKPSDYQHMLEEVENKVFKIPRFTNAQRAGISNE